MEYVNDLALIPEQSFKKNGEGKGERKSEKYDARGGENAAPARAEWARAQSRRRKGIAREAPRLSPVGSPCLVPHMVFLPRREGGEAIMLLNKSPKRAKRRGWTVYNAKFNRCFWVHTSPSRVLPCLGCAFVFGWQLQYDLSCLKISRVWVWWGEVGVKSQSKIWKWLMRSFAVTVGLCVSSKFFSLSFFFALLDAFPLCLALTNPAGRELENLLLIVS